MVTVHSEPRRSVLLCGIFARVLIVTLAAVLIEITVGVLAPSLLAVTSFFPLVVPYPLYEVILVAWPRLQRATLRGIALLVVVGCAGTLLYLTLIPTLIGVILAFIFTLLFDVVQIEPRVERLLDRVSSRTATGSPSLFDTDPTDSSSVDRDGNDWPVETIPYHPEEATAAAFDADESSDETVCPDCGLRFENYLVGEFCPRCGREVRDLTDPIQIE